MKFHLLGTAGYHPSDTRQTGCFMLPEIGLVLDAGTGMYRVRDLLCTKTLDIFLTHAHLDHCIGLTYLFDVLHGKTVEQVTVHAEAEKLKAVCSMLQNKLLFPVDLPCAWNALSADPIQVGGGGTMTHFPLEHPGGAIGYRIDWPDRSFAYVSDTTAKQDSEYISAIRGVDLLIHECNFTDNETELAELTGHSCVTPVCEAAKAADVGQLVLVHFNPIADQDAPVDLKLAQSVFKNTTLGVDGMVIDF